MKKVIIGSLMLCAVLSLNGCVYDASVDLMTFTPKVVKKSYNDPLAKSISVAKVSGGNEFSAFWISRVKNSEFKTALRRSLKIANLYTSPDKAKYQLSVHLVKLKQPFFIGDYTTVRCSVRYKLTNLKSNKIVYNKIINSSYTVRIINETMGSLRLEIATEEAVRINIGKLINDLYKLR